jgi:hypothetical protein
LRTGGFDYLSGMSWRTIMNTTEEHNQTLQQHGGFSQHDLDENRQSRYSQSQRKRFETEREFFQSSADKYQNTTPLISMIFLVGLLIFVVILYFVGVFDTLQSVLGLFFFPSLACAGTLALLFILIIIPRHYQSSVDQFKAMGTPLAENPLGGNTNCRCTGRVVHFTGQDKSQRKQSGKKTYVLKMAGIEFKLTSSFLDSLQQNRLYRVYAVEDQGLWVLLSMETLE